MERETTYEFIHSIKAQISTSEFEEIKEKLICIPANHRAAFWYLVSFGYSATSAITNCKNMFEFVQNNFIDYGNAIELIRCENKIKYEGETMLAIGSYILN